jgi:hypothetical protein
MNRFSICGAALALALMTSPASAANLLANPGFEDPITYEGTQFVGSWEGFAGGALALAANSGSSPRSGAMHLILAITNSDNNFSGAFQDVPGMTPGSTAVFSGWHKAVGPLDATPEFRIEWRNSVSNTEVGRTNALTPTLGSEYSPFSMSAPVPAGADTARVVYAIQTFTGPAGNNATVFVDDVSLEVPEPGAMTLCAAGGLLMAVRRRRGVC